MKAYHVTLCVEVEILADSEQEAEERGARVLRVAMSDADGHYKDLREYVRAEALADFARCVVEAPRVWTTIARLDPDPLRPPFKCEQCGLGFCAGWISNDERHGLKARYRCVKCRPRGTLKSSPGITITEVPGE